MYIYKDITNTQWDISLFFLVCLDLQVWLKGWLMSVYALLVKQNDLSAAVCCCTDVMRWMTWFLHQRFRIIVLKNWTVWSSNVYYVLWWYLIPIHDWLKSYQISETCQSRTCSFLSSRNPDGAGGWGGGGFPGSLAMVNLLAWSKVFHVKFHLDLMDSQTLSCWWSVRFSVYMFACVVRRISKG